MASDKKEPFSSSDNWKSLSPELLKALQTVERDFTVDAAKLKRIAEQFEKELRDGLEKDGSNIVGPKMPTSATARV